MNTLLQDLRYAARLLVKNPGFSVVALLAIALGIATATTMFTFFNGVLLRPMPGIANEERLVSLKVVVPGKYEQGSGFSQPNFLDLREQTRTLENPFLLQERTIILAGGDKPERLLGAWISATGLQTLGVQPALGRLFRPEEENDGAPAVALLNYEVWQRRFGGRDSVLGQSVVLNGEPVTVVGVLPRGFRFPVRTEVWMPFRYHREEIERADFSYPVWARLRPGVTLAQAQVEMNVIAARLVEAHPATNTGVGIRARAMREEMTADVRRLLQLLLGAVIFVLLIACANVANLLLAKGASRSREIAIRAALGAGRGRIARQLLSESLLLGLAGGLLGVLLSLWGVDLVLGAIPVQLPYWLRFDLDWRVMLFGFAAAGGSGLLFGLFPAWQASRPDLNRELKEGGRASTGGASAHRVRNALVVAQIALALVLLVGAGLMTRSFLHLQRANPGLDPLGVLTFRTGLPPTQFKDDESERFFHDLAPRLAAIPGVEAAGLVDALPGSENYSFSPFQVEGRPRAKSLLDAPGSMRRAASPGVFAALRIPLRRGRLFQETDGKDAPRVALVDQRFADEIFPGEDPVGKRLLVNLHELAAGKEEAIATVVGVVGNVRQQIQPRLPERCLWLPTAQASDNFRSGVLRVQGDPLSYVRAVQSAVLATQADIPIYYPKPMETVVAESFWQQRFFGFLFAGFAGVALFLAAVGIYGVMAYSVTQRTQEIGVRMALGALPRDVIRLVVGRGARLVGIGLVIGLLASRGLSQLLAGSLFGVSPGDPPVFFSVPLLLAGVALLACWLPSRRATRISPMVALRQE